MTDDLEHPWFPEVMDLLDLRRQDRVLLVTAERTGYVKAILQRIGPQGDVLVVEPSKKSAKELAQVSSRVEVIARVPTGDEVFGTFDAVLASPFGMPSWPLSLWTGVTVRNLRPGGRFAIDLPGEELCEDLSVCWLEIGGAEGDLVRLRGPAERDLATSLRQGGLRMVAAAMGTHVVRMDSPHTLASMGAALLGADPDQQEELGIALTRRLRTTNSAEVVFHRTRVHGIR